MAGKHVDKRNIEQIVSDKTVRDRLEKNGRSLAKRYDWSSVEQQIMELYR